MGGGTGMSSSEFLKIQEEMNERRQYSLYHPAYIKGFETPALLHVIADSENADREYPEQILQTISATYKQHLKPEIRNCPAKEVRFCVTAGQSVLQGKVTKSGNILQADNIVISLEGRCNHKPLAVDLLEFKSNAGMLSKNIFRITSAGCGMCLVDENNKWIEGSEKSISHSSAGHDLRLLDHLLYLEQSLQNKTAKVEIAPIVKQLPRVNYS